MPEAWVDACAADAIDEEDVVRFDRNGRTFAIYRTDDDRYFATDGLCTHEKVHLADGLVMGRFHADVDNRLPGAGATTPAVGAPTRRSAR